EHVWHPFRLAEALEAMGYQTAFCATTRSPIHLGEVIRQTMTFADHFGLGVPMYLHNVRRQDWDRVILMTETGIEGIDERLKAQLFPSMIIDGTGRVHASEP
ncbi:MAG: TRSP domain-containing protein, partial [Candidatus Saccharibacteria bacterium]|nr:TRSP domain-containing protein [Pseudorhodobacter sp.]